MQLVDANPSQEVLLGEVALEPGDVRACPLPMQMSEHCTPAPPKGPQRAAVLPAFTLSIKQLMSLV